MNTLMMAGLLVLTCAAPGRAEETTSATYDGGVRYMDLDSRGSKGQVQEYDGKLYFIGHGDVGVSNQGSRGLFDIQIKDIGSTEENAAINLDFGSSFKGGMSVDKISHRQNMTDYGVIIDSNPTGQAGLYTKIPNTLAITMVEPDKNVLYKRTATEVNLALFSQTNSAQWISAQYWSAVKKGDAIGSYSGGSPSRLRFDRVYVDNTTLDFVLGLGSNVTENGAMSLDLLRREFKDESAVLTYGTGATQQIRPAFPHTQMSAAEMKFRYDVSKKLALTAALTGRQRENLSNGYKMNAAVAAFNAAYKASNKLSLTARLYGRVVEIDETPGYQNWRAQATMPANTHEFDTLIVKGDFAASYRPCEKALLKAGYRMEATHRRDAPSEIFTATTAFYTDGVYRAAGQDANSVANDDVKHIFSAGMKAELPLGVEAEADYKKLYANRAAFVNLPTRSDEASASLFVPLPGHVHASLLGGYLSEGNRIGFTNYHQTRNTYRAGLDWETDNKVFVGADATYETIRYYTEGWLGISSNWPLFASGIQHVPGMGHYQKNTTAGLHGRVNLPKGFAVIGNGSYTWSTIHTPLNITSVNDATMTLRDSTPSDVRIARGAVTVEYTPAKYKSLTARAGYRIDDWVDKYDNSNSGRASVTQVGVSAKF